MALILGLSALSVVPGVQAAADAVDGVSALVLGESDPNFVLVRWFVSPDDTDQDQGDWTYNITADAGSGFVQILTDGDVQDGVGSELLQLSAGFSYSFNVTADDGTGPVDSCIVTIDASVQFDFDACGEMDADTSFDEFFCLNTESPRTGFNYAYRLEVTGGGNIEFNAGVGTGLGRLARAGLNLAGDTAALRLSTELQFASDGVPGEHRIFFSEVDTPVSSSAFGDGESTGAFANGVGFIFKEGEFSIDSVEIYRAQNGQLIQTFFDTSWSSGNPQDYQTLVITLNPYAGVFQLQYGSESTTIYDEGLADPYYSVWLSEGWEDTNTKSRVKGGNGFCLSSVDDPGFAGLGGENLENFEGQGGTGGPPMFPGVDVEETSDALGVEAEVFAWILAMVAIVGIAFLGFLVAKAAGAGLGLLLGVVAGVAFNLIPLWLVVLLFLLAVTVIVLGVRQ